MAISYDKRKDKEELRAKFLYLDRIKKGLGNRIDEINQSSFTEDRDLIELYNSIEDIQCDVLDRMANIKVYH